MDCFTVFTLATYFGPVNKKESFKKILIIEFCNEDTVGHIFDKYYVHKDLDLNLRCKMEVLINLTMFKRSFAKDFAAGRSPVPFFHT